MNNEAIFVGYQTLEELMTVVDKQHPVFVLLATERGKPSRYGNFEEKLVINVAQPANDLVHYWRMVMATVQYYAEGIPLSDQERAAKIESAQNGLALVKTWLSEQGIVMREGIISTPQNLRLLDGWASFLGFDREKQIFFRKGLQE